MQAILEYPTLRAAANTAPGAIGLTAIAFLVGTGGAQTAEYYRQRGRMGYAFATYDPAPISQGLRVARTPAEDLSHIRAVLKPAIADLARALGVSRQAVYDWQNGKPIAAENAARLADIARAADVFAAEGLTTSAQLLRRPIASGKRLFDIVHDGGSAEHGARKLIQNVRREIEQRQRLTARLARGKRPAVTSDDYGAPVLEE